MKITVHEARCHEGNPVSGLLPAAIDKKLQDIAQEVGVFEYTDIIELGKIWDALDEGTRRVFTGYVKRSYREMIEDLEAGDDEAAQACAEDLSEALFGLREFIE